MWRCPRVNKSNISRGPHVTYDWPIASWVVVTWGLLLFEHTDTTENITFPQLRWFAVMDLIRVLKTLGSSVMY